jgi:hypothetical protein
MGQRCRRFTGHPGDQIKVAGARRAAKMSGCNKLWLVCAVDRTDTLPTDAGEQWEVATPHRGRKAKVTSEESVDSTKLPNTSDAEVRSWSSLE